MVTVALRDVEVAAAEYPTVVLPVPVCAEVTASQEALETADQEHSGPDAVIPNEPVPPPAGALADAAATENVQLPPPAWLMV
jgi:hypothetical protein